MKLKLDMTKALALSDALSQYVENATDPELLDTPAERIRQEVRVNSAQEMLDQVDAFIAGAAR